MLNIGIIGAGKIADLHTPGYLENPDVRIYAVATARTRTGDCHFGLHLNGYLPYK